jgi:hypothetical protein
MQQKSWLKKGLGKNIFAWFFVLNLTQLNAISLYDRITQGPFHKQKHHHVHCEAERCDEETQNNDPQEL